MNLNELRKQLRKQRRNLNIWQQRQAECAISRYFRHHRLQNAQKIGVYLHAFGEVYTQKLVEYCFKHGKKVYLPMVCRMNQHLHWVNISAGQYYQHRFVLHRLKMYEAKNHRGVDVKQLDVLFMPLLACDTVGMRLGMGGGFYDRTLVNAPHRPYRIGLAHDFQYLLEDLPYQTWDEGLDELWTPQKCYRFKRLKSSKVRT